MAGMHKYQLQPEPTGCCRQVQQYYYLQAQQQQQQQAIGRMHPGWIPCNCAPGAQV